MLSRLLADLLPLPLPQISSVLWGLIGLLLWVIGGLGGYWIWIRREERHQQQRWEALMRARQAHPTPPPRSTTKRP